MADAGIEKPDTRRALARLKPFQRDTVDYVFRRLYTDADCTRRFLVADEVGLGKTMVARGVIARAIDHLEADIERIDIVYICANADIARQNLQRLNLTGNRNAAGVGRLTLLPAMLPRLDPHLNFVAFTPGTSFNMGSSSGQWQERALLYWMLEQLGYLPTNARGSALSQGAAQLFQAGVTRLADWKRRLLHRHLPGVGPVTIEPTLRDRFKQALDRQAVQARAKGQLPLTQRIATACAELKGRSIRHVATGLRQETRIVTGELRMLLAGACLNALEPDLVILDEFQRFRDLLDPDNEAGALAHSLFDYADKYTAVRTLLLSATPYKMYTLHAETDTDDHYRDFIRTLGFLCANATATAGIADLLQGMRRALYRIPAAGMDEAQAYRTTLEARLRKVMVRTERARGTDSGDDMVREVTSNRPALSAADANRYLGLQRIVRSIDGPDMIEYWKSAPYLLNFMDVYQVKRNLRTAIDAGANAELTIRLYDNQNLLLAQSMLAGYRPIEPGNARLRSLLDALNGDNLWRMLWLPPSLAPYRLAGAYRYTENAAPTKRLIFSAWRVVPKAIAALVSYDVERRLHRRFDAQATNTQEARDGQARLLRFDISDDRPIGLPLFTLVYPSSVLARIGGEALTTAANQAGDRPPDPAAALAHAEAGIRARLPVDIGNADDTSVNQAWYWVTPMLLDLAAEPEQTRRWWQRRDLAYRWSHDEQQAGAAGWNTHLDRAREVIDGQRPAGPPPDDLVELLAEVALAAPATSALRSLRAVAAAGAAGTPHWLRDGAARMGWGYRRLFNQIETAVLIRGECHTRFSQPYWRQALRYAFEGGLTAVNDEYAHVLAEATAAGDQPPERATARIVAAFDDAIALPLSRVGWDEIEWRSRLPAMASDTLRTHFAARFGQAESEDGLLVTREDQVRAAFNSPFWPFVLASTSVGQEGLDFHHYCHALVHWNLPSNPVDMEQREGRIHRYKGHAVRKNIARRFATAGRAVNYGDRWQTMFDRARAADTGSGRGLVPEWNYPLPEGACIERHVPTLAFSRDVGKYRDLRRSLAAYRMVFGQARQEDLLAYLLEHVDATRLTEFASRLRIDLSPTR